MIFYISLRRKEEGHCMQAFRDAIEDCNLVDMGYIAT
jgi:hypothetical protein